MGTFTKSNGDKIEKKTLDARISKAKDKYSANFEAEEGYIYCERHKRNDCRGISRSHIISVNECQNSARAELAYCEHNLEHLCQVAHEEIEVWSHEKREAWYWARQEKIPFDDFIIDWELENG